jgi:hypothetical protein
LVAPNSKNRKVGEGAFAVPMNYPEKVLAGTLRFAHLRFSSIKPVR